MSTSHLTLYNSLSRSLEPFSPLDPANVRVYSCGPTVYDYAHLGNLRAYVFTDTLARTLRWKGYPLTHVMNITDVGHLQSDADEGADKMEARAQETGRDIWAIARHYTDAFERNLRDLNIEPVSRMPLATDHVPQMIAFAETIADSHCYLLESGLYFDTGTVPDYGRLAGRSGDERESRIAPVTGKRHPEDFAIWRRSAPGENRQVEWDSPWGRGAPGWHLECSVMSRMYLGERFDIHTGGIDHREIHHPNEIAQNQAFHGAHLGCTAEPGFTGATLWMHNNFLVERAGKMSKSSGEFLTLQAILDRGHHPLAYRLMCLQAHYRSEMEFSWDGLAAAGTRLKRLVTQVEQHRVALTQDENNESLLADACDPEPLADDELMRAFDTAMSNDLNTPEALTILGRALAGGTVKDVLGRLRHFDAVLGLDLLTLRREDLRVRPAQATIDASTIEARLSERREARAAKDFARSDAIRDELVRAGVDVMDGDRLRWDWKLTA